jgi:DNA end-binding protein Ku
LYVATDSKSQINFHQISRSTGERVRHQKVLQSAVDQPTGEAAEVVENDEIVKGYEYSKGKYVVIEPSELENLRVPSKHVIAVDQFIDQDELNPEYVEKPYFVVPENDGQSEAFAVVRQALENTGKVAIGKVAFAGRENVVAIAPAGNRGMMAYTLRYAGELRDQSEYFRDIKDVEIKKDELELAESLISKRAAKFDPSKFVDGYEVAVKELVDAKINHMPIPKDEEQKQPRGKVINLMDALRRSVRSEAAADEKPAAVRKGPTLVKGASKPAAKKASKSAARLAKTATLRRKSA